MDKWLSVTWHINKSRCMSGFPRWHSGNEFTFRCKRLKRCKRSGFNTCVVKIPWEGNGNPLQYSCLKFHVQRSLAGYSSWDCEESDTTEHTHITLRYVTLRYVTLHYICISLLRLGKRTLNLDSVNPFFPSYCLGHRCGSSQALILQMNTMTW